MATDAPVEYDETTKDLGDKIVGLTLLEAKKLADYLKDVHGIEPAGGGVVMAAAAPGEASAAAEEKTEFDVILTGFGDNKIKVINYETGKYTYKGMIGVAAARWHPRIANLVLMGGIDGSIALVDIIEDQTEQEYDKKGDMVAVQDLCWNPGEDVFLAHYRDG